MHEHRSLSSQYADKTVASLLEALRLVADHLSQLAWIAKPTGEVRWFNSRWFEYTGQSPHDINGREWRLVMRDEDVARTEARFRDAAAAGSGWEDTIPMRRHDGLWRWFLLRALPVRRADGTITAWFGTNTDITQQREAAHELADAKVRLELALDAAKMGVWDWNLRTGRVRWTGQIYRALGLPEHNESIGNSFIDHILPEDRERVLPEINGAIESGRDFDVEFRFVAPEDRVHWVVSRGRSVLGVDGKPEQALGVNFDITLRKHIEDQLREADARRNEFLAMLAHELRNPLAPIVTSMELLPRIGELLPAQQSIVEVVQRQAQHLTRLVDDLLEVSRVTQGRIEIRKAQVHLADVVRDAQETVRPLLEQRKHRITTDVDQTLQLEADPARMTQVLVNVLNNAIKFTPDGGLIQLAAAADYDQSMVIRVTDNGVGIGADVLPHIFDLFTQGDRSLHRSQGGLGIGLALVRRLVELHGGSVWASSPGEGRGTTVYIRLPRHLPAASESRDTNHETASTPEPLRLVVVDDNEDAAQSLGLLLEADGHDVKLAFNAEHGLRLIRENRPSAALLDIGMPGTNGYELARLVRQDPHLADVGLVALTGYGSRGDRERSKAAGFDAHLLKPASAADIYSALADAMKPRSAASGCATGSA